jgi:hypothetical protein
VPQVRFASAASASVPSPVGVRNCDHALDLRIRSGRRRRASAPLDATEESVRHSIRLPCWRKCLDRVRAVPPPGLEYVGPQISSLKGAFIQIMPLTWDSFLLPVMDKTPGSRSDWFCIGLRRGSLSKTLVLETQEPGVESVSGMLKPPAGRAWSVLGPIREWAGRGRDQSFCALQASKPSSPGPRSQSKRLRRTMGPHRQT